jgi:hypothetical protein
MIINEFVREGTPVIMKLIEEENKIRRVITMNGQKLNQEWQQLQANIENFLGQALTSDIHRLEYKPRFITQLLELPSEDRQNERQEMSK